MLSPDIVHSHEIQMFSDASGFAAGGFVRNHWYQLTFTKSERMLFVHHKECFAVFLLLVIANMVYDLRGRKLRMWCDNEGLVKLFRPPRMVSKDLLLMKCIRKIQFFAIKNGFSFVFSWIAGKKNIVADDISRYRQQKHISNGVLTTSSTFEHESFDHFNFTLIVFV